LLLTDAAQSGNLENTRRLVSSGASLEARNAEGFTPLMLAAFHGHTPVLKLLLGGGADPAAHTRNGTTSLMLAVHAGRHDCLATLLEAGADVNAGTIEGHVPLHEAVARGDVRSTRLLLHWGAKPDVYNSRGRTPLHEAARSGYPDVVQLLLEYGANFAARSRDDLTWSAWEFAKQGGHGSVLGKLTSKGAALPRRANPPARASMRSRLADVLERPFFLRSAIRMLYDVQIRVSASRELEATYIRLGSAMDLIHANDKRIIERMRQCGIAIWVPGRLSHNASYEAGLRVCLLSSEYVLDGTTWPAAIAGAIVHEITHARTWSPLYERDVLFRARTERLCLEAQRDFLKRVPGALRLADAAGERSRSDPIIWSNRAITRRKLRWLMGLLRVV
jgi:hypothetical protein